MARRRLLILLVVQAAALWPVWRWAALRVADGDADEIVALAACAAALLIAPRRSREPHDIAAPSLLTLPALLTLAYAASVLAAPPVLRAAIASCALLATWCAWRWGARPHPAAMGLAVLALPALPTAQFMLGYPLRVVAGEVAARLLALAGFAVERDGVSLRAGERLVAIDAPCSGVNMLWTALLLALVLAALAGLSWPRTALLAAAAATLAVAGNGLRAASLFLVETGAVPVPPRLDADAVHAALGVVAFALIATPLLWTCRQWQGATTS